MKTVGSGLPHLSRHWKPEDPTMFGLITTRASRTDKANICSEFQELELDAPARIYSGFSLTQA